MDNLLNRVIGQFDTLIPFLAISNEDIFRLINREKNIWFTQNQRTSLPSSYKIYRTQITHSAFLLGYSYFEAFLADLVRQVFMSRPRMLPMDKQLKYGEILKTTNYEAILEMMVEKEIIDLFYKRMDEVEIFFKRNTRLASKIVEFKRVDIPEYPYEAIREAVINAIAHRDYTRRGAPIIVSIFDDRVEISSPGGLLPGLDIRNLEGRHETRNKKICEIFHQTLDMEKFGTGIGKMKRLMKEHGLSKPNLAEEGNFFVVKFYGAGEKILDLVPSVPKERQIDLRELGLNDRQIEALRLMVNEKKVISNKEYVKQFNVTRKTALRDFKVLENLRYVKAEGTTRDRKYKAI